MPARSGCAATASRSPISKFRYSSELIWAEVAEHYPAACGTEINCCHVPRLTHRRNAAATPASTGMCRPVV